MFLQWNHPLAEHARLRIEDIVQRPIQWTALTDWYGKYIDAKPVVTPLTDRAIPPNEEHAVSGTPIQFTAPYKGQLFLSFHPASQGVFVRATIDEQVKSVADGRVIFTGEFPGIGHTVIVQHANGFQSWYGMLQTVEVEKQQWLPARAIIGAGTKEHAAANSYLFFAIKDGAQFINPLDMIRFE